MRSALGADRALALSYVPAGKRSAMAALFAIDAAMGDVLRTTTEPQLGAIRLAWWREQLEALDAGEPISGEPRLDAIRQELLPRRITGSALAGLESGWLRLFDPFPWDVGTTEAIWFRGRRLFALGAQLLDRTSDDVEEAGGLWALTDAARHCSDRDSRRMLAGQARKFAKALGGARYAPALRPLSMLAALAIRDCRRGEPYEPEGAPARAAVMLRHRLSGRLPRL